MGNRTPRVVLTQPPPLPATDHDRRPLQRSDIRLDGSIIVPAAGHGLTGSHPILATCCFSLLAGKNKPKTCISFFGGASLFSPGKSLRSRCLGFGFCQSSRNVLDEWVCSFQGSKRGQKRTSHPICRWVRGSITTKTYFSRKLFNFLRIFIFLL